ncbi:type I restriction endonuclease subunit R [Actinobacillus equuli]|uniref:type I site-specific deoxyribonuclease n=1 Tax=Actinobacillus equuli TaxID=718 RepID=A0AAX3FJM1_ACTEU|nr:type I restriction endonuclease [Actinobacillus equuli]AIZ80281.1 restriction endonuclease subunit R [Actinobacillus equuli subsp. equuli]WGE44387.1 type I restriction endonuclease [Actinobacillus equuli subsp. equuli]VEE91656.1 type I restriction enzyme, R subunit [Actinobacillus equuli]
MTARYNEKTRVQIPAVAHLGRLGYQYLSLKTAQWDVSNNIFGEVFKSAIAKINPNLTTFDLERELKNVAMLLKNEDLGQAFYKRLLQVGTARLIDFDCIENNQFHVVAELTCGDKDGDNFRPDITLLINGLPLVFLEVKKPNAQNGLQSEFERMQYRCKKPAFRPYINATQLMVFSNNQEYQTADRHKTQGAFYATTGFHGVQFNYFRDEGEIAEEQAVKLNENLAILPEAELNRILLDFNEPMLKNDAEFRTNLDPNSPTNRLCTALLHKERLLFLLKYGIAYVEEQGGMEKHVMRYPQLFATKAISRHLAAGKKKGIIWHTQGSGKTALAYYNVRVLTDFYQRQNVIPKFYFIVDRLDLRNQAMSEFSHRGLQVNSINSREEFAQEMRKAAALSNYSGDPEITVVNIQKFQNSNVAEFIPDYDISVQRIFFIDEAHRSFGNQAQTVSQFLASLIQADPSAVHIGLTGTPLLGGGKNRVGSTAIFGDYIHKYYYNQSIADGYTLRLIREEIESNYKAELSQILADLQIQQGSIKSRTITSRRRFVEPMLDYIVQDFEKFRRQKADNSLGAMVICDSSDQARMMHFLFNQKYAENPQDLTAYREKLAENDPHFFDELPKVAESTATYNLAKRTVTSASLILSDEGDKTYRKDLVDDYKAGKTDLLFVYNMLLTGFDAKRLKKLYLGRVIKEHNLLQALTRVNRTYKDYEFGYVVDFADIQAEFDKTNAAYQAELQLELGDEAEHYSQLFKSQAEIDQDIAQIKEVLFDFETENAEIFRQQLDEIDDKQKLLELKRTLELARSLYNQLKVDEKSGLERLDFEQYNVLYRQVLDRLFQVNTMERVDSGDLQGVLNEALENIYFTFHKKSEAELKLADSLQDQMRKTREAFARNIDQKDPEFVRLLDELKHLFEKRNVQSVSQAEMQMHIDEFAKLERQIGKLNAENDRLSLKFAGDAKFVRIFKRGVQDFGLQQNRSHFMEGLQQIKFSNDQFVLNQGDLLQSSSSYFEKESLRTVTKLKSEFQLPLDNKALMNLNKLIVSEYIGA